MKSHGHRPGSKEGYAPVGFGSGGTRIRTGDTMILSRKTQLLAHPDASGDSVDLSGFSTFSEEGNAVVFGSVLARLQYTISGEALET